MVVALPRVLIVDDDAAFASVLESVLKTDGYQTHVVASGEDALDILCREQFEVVFTDLKLEGIDGIQLTEAIRHEYPNTEVVLISAYATVEATAQALRLGAYDFILKPLDNVQIVSAVMKRLGDKIRLNRQNQLFLRDLQSNNVTLVRLNQTLKALYDDIVGFYIDTQRRNATLTMETVYGRGIASLREFSGARDVILLRYDAARQTLAGERAVAADPADVKSLSLAVRTADFAGLAESVALNALIDGVFGTREPLVVPILHGQTPWGVIAVLERPDGAFSIFERNLLRQFVDWLALAFEGAHLYKTIFDLSTIDGLTGLFNHRYFQERLKAEIARGARYKHSVSLLFCDLDNFKVYNDTKGHIEGDRLLREIARSFRNKSRASDSLIAFRESDIAARYGGEEFVLILPETPLDGALIKAERARKAIEATAFRFQEVLPGGRVTMSVGVAEFPRHAKTREELVAAADRAMYRAKQAGKNRVATPDGPVATLGAAAGDSPIAQ